MYVFLFRGPRKSLPIFSPRALKVFPRPALLFPDLRDSNLQWIFILLFSVWFARLTLVVFHCLFTAVQTVWEFHAVCTRCRIIISDKLNALFIKTITTLLTILWLTFFTIFPTSKAINVRDNAISCPCSELWCTYTDVCRCPLGWLLRRHCNIHLRALLNESINQNNIVIFFYYYY